MHAVSPYTEDWLLQNKQTSMWSTLFMDLLFLLGSPRTMFVQICHEYNIVCKHTEKYFIGLGVTKENNKDPASSFGGNDILFWANRTGTPAVH